LGYTWLKEMNPLIDWKKETLEWRKWKHSVLKKQPEESKTIKYYTFVKGMIEKTEPKKPKSGKKSKPKKQPVIMITEEDKEEYLNHTQNPLNKEEDRLEQVIFSMTKEDNIWINAKGTKSTEIQIEINKKKETITVWQC
jgi:hypothetical protein